MASLHHLPPPVVPSLSRLVHIAVGTPGRVSALLEGGRLEGSRLALLVLDEADSLLGDSFYEQVTWVYDQLPKRKQVRASRQGQRRGQGWSRLSG